MGTTGYELKPIPAGCDCICHTEKGVMHIQACCQPCRTCGQLVAIETIEAHEKDCAAGRVTP